MAVAANTVTNATGGFAPSGAFSLEFRSRSKRTGKIPESTVNKAEFFFLLGLTKVDKTFSYLISTKPTYGGASVTDYGNGLVNTVISGEIYAHYSGKPYRKPTGAVNSGGAALGAVGDAALGMLDEVNPVKKSGYLDFFDLIWLLHSSRSEYGYKSVISDFYSSAVGLYETAQSMKAKMIIPLAGYINFEEIGIIFHDYDSNFHYEVSFDPSGLTISQSADDPLTWNFSIRLVGIADYSKPVPFRRPPLPNARAMINNALFTVNDLFNDITSVTRFVADATTALNSITNLCEKLKTDFKSFQATNKALFKQIRLTTKQIRNKSKELTALITAYWNNQTTPTPSEYTLPNADFTLTATDPTIYDLSRLTSAIAQIETALILLDNEINNTTGNAGVDLVTVRPGDTLESLAIKYYGSADRIGDLILLNSNQILTQNLAGNSLPQSPTSTQAQPFSTEALIGQVIKVPSSSTTYQIPANTGVIAQQPNVSNLSPTQIQTQLELITLGTDLAVDPNGDFVIEQGDLGVVQGINSLAQNLLDLMQSDISVIPLHPDFETGFIPGEVPDEYLGTIGFQKILNKISQQQGVASARILRNRLDSNMIFLDVAIKPIGNFEEFVIKYKKALQ